MTTDTLAARDAADDLSTLPTPSVTARESAAADRALRKALREIAEVEGLQMLSADDLEVINRHSMIVSRRHLPHLDSAEIESQAVGIAAQLLVQGSDRPRVATLKAACKIAARRVVAERMRHLPAVKHSDDIGRYTAGDTATMTDGQREAVASAVTHSYLWPLCRKFPKAARLDAITASRRGAEGAAWSDASSEGFSQMLINALGAEITEAVTDAFVDAKVAAYSTDKRPAGTVLRPARIAWKEAAEAVGANRGTLYREVIRSLGGDLPSAKAMAHTATVKALA